MLPHIGNAPPRFSWCTGKTCAVGGKRDITAWPINEDIVKVTSQFIEEHEKNIKSQQIDMYELLSSVDGCVRNESMSSPYENFTSHLTEHASET